MNEGFVFLNQQGKYAYLTKASSWSECMEVSFTDNLDMAYVFRLGEIKHYESQLQKAVRVPAKVQRKVILGE